MSGVDETTYRDDHADTAAERLGGPSESVPEQTTDPAHETTHEQAHGSAHEATAEPAQQASSGPAGEKNATLIAPDKAGEYQSRWKELKGEFVDEPLSAVRGANELVGEVLDELEALFRRQREELERGLDSEETSTEDLRLALGRYRSFFDRLLTI